MKCLLYWKCYFSRLFYQIEQLSVGHKFRRRRSHISLKAYPLIYFLVWNKCRIYEWNQGFISWDQSCLLLMWSSTSSVIQLLVKCLRLWEWAWARTEEGCLFNQNIPSSNAKKATTTIWQDQPEGLDRNYVNQHLVSILLQFPWWNDSHLMCWKKKIR